MVHCLEVGCRHGLHFINYPKIKKSQAVARKDQTKGLTTESLEQFCVVCCGRFKSDDCERKRKVCKVLQL